MTPAPQLIDTDDLIEYPLDGTERLDSHYFVPWERRRWLNSDMRLKGTAECRALYLDLLWISYDHTPLGTLPVDIAVLARLLGIDRTHFETLCGMQFGPLHKWQRCRCGDEIRLYHPFILSTVVEAISRKADNRARTEKANRYKRQQRLRSALGTFDPKLVDNDHAVAWIDEWLEANSNGNRTGAVLERALHAWVSHIRDLSHSPMRRQ